VEFAPAQLNLGQANSLADQLKCFTNTGSDSAASQFTVDVRCNVGKRQALEEWNPLPGCQKRHATTAIVPDGYDCTGKTG